MKTHSVTWKFTYMNDDGNFSTAIGSEKNESSAIKQLWSLAAEHKCKSVESYFTSIDGTVIHVSPLSGKVKRN